MVELGILLALVGAFIWFISTKPEREAAAEKERLQSEHSSDTEDSVKRYIETNAITGKHFEFPCNNGIAVLADGFSAMAYIDGKSTSIIPFSSIISVDIDKTMGSTTTSTKNGVVGRVLLGGLIGATTAGSTSVTQEYVAKAAVKIHTNDLNCHTLVIPADSEESANNVEGIVLALKSKC